jgi:membrane protease YdiL (CAAX protease family)
MPQQGGAKLSPSIMGAAASLLLMIMVLSPIGGWIFRGDDLTARIEREALFWAFAVATIFYVALIERRPLSSIGLKPPRWTNLLIGIAGALATIVGMAVIYLVVFPAFRLSDTSQTASILSTPLWFRLALVTRAAIFEEIFFRGFMIERLSELTRLRWLGGCLSLAAFTFAHLDRWGWAHLIVAGFGGAVLTLLYLWRRDLFANMVAHFLTDAIGFLLS